MIAVAYLLPPLTGLFVYLRAAPTRARLHGLQSVAFGTAVPILLYVASWVGPGATRVTFAVCALAWVALFLLALARRAPLILPLRRSEALIRDET